MTKITISDFSGGFASIDALNAAFQDLEDELNNKVLYRKNPQGEANSMQSDLDMNGKSILNVSTWESDNLACTNLTINGELVVPSELATSVLPDQTSQDGKFLTTDGSTAFWEALTNIPFQLDADAIERTIQEKLSDIISVKDFGAVGDGTTDDTAAIQAAIDYCADQIDNTSTGVNSISLLIPEGIYSVSNTLTIPTVNRFNLNAIGGIKANNWVGSSSDPILQLNCRQSVINLGTIDCNSLCNGVVANGYNLTVNDADILHFTEYGFKHEGGGNSLFSNITAWQWLQVDADFEVDASWTASCFIADSIDSTFVDCKGAWAGLALEVTENAKNMTYIGCHFWNGRPDAVANGWTKPDNPTIVKISTSSKQLFVGCYFDNGHIDSYGGGLVIIGGHYLNLTANVVLDHPYIRFYASIVNQDLPLPKIVDINASVGFYSYGGNNFAGDYTDINALDVSTNLGEYLHVGKKIFNILPNDNTEDAEIWAKPGGSIIFKYKVAGRDDYEFRHTTTESRMHTDLFRVISTSTAVPHKLKIGGGNVGLHEDTAGELTLYTGSSSFTFSAKALQGPTTTVASLPSASVKGAGTRAFVTDATATAFGSVVAGGGSNNVPVYSDGTDWRIG